MKGESTTPKKPVDDRFGPKKQAAFTPTAEKPHRSPLQEPDEIPGLTEVFGNDDAKANGGDSDAEFWSEAK